MTTNRREVVVTETELTGQVAREAPAGHPPRRRAYGQARRRGPGQGSLGR
jgi:hypothetical protein